MINLIKKLYYRIFKTNIIRIEYNTLQDTLYKFYILYKLMNDISIYNYNKPIIFTYRTFSLPHHVFIINYNDSLLLYASDYIYLDLLTTILKAKDV